MIGRLVLVSVFTLVGLGEGEVSAIPPLVLLAQRHDSFYGLSLIIERERSKQVGLCSFREAVSPELLEYFASESTSGRSPICSGSIGRFECWL